MRQIARNANNRLVFAFFILVNRSVLFSLLSCKSSLVDNTKSLRYSRAEAGDDVLHLIYVIGSSYEYGITIENILIAFFIFVKFKCTLYI